MLAARSHAEQKGVLWTDCDDEGQAEHEPLHVRSDRQTPGSTDSGTGKPVQLSENKKVAGFGRNHFFLDGSQGWASSPEGSPGVLDRRTPNQSSRHSERWVASWRTKAGTAMGSVPLLPTKMPEEPF